MKIQNAFKLIWAIVFFVLCSLTLNGANAANDQAKIDGLSLGQNDSVLKKFKNATKQNDEKQGTITYTIKRKGDRDLIVVVDVKTNKLVQIALIQNGDNDNNNTIFNGFTLGKTRNRDIVKDLDTPPVKNLSTKYLAQIIPNIKEQNALQYFLEDDIIYTFVTKPRAIPENTDAIVENGKAFIIDPASSNRLKEDVRIQDGYLKAVILTQKAYAEKLIGRDIVVDPQNIIKFLQPTTIAKRPQSQFQLLNKYKTGAVYNGEKHALSFSNENEAFRTSQSTIREGYKLIDKPIFASEYSVIPVTFSVQSNDYYFYNLKTGKLNKFPLGADKAYLKLITRPDFSVLEARWEEDGVCKRSYYQLNNGEWNMLKTDTLNGDADSCETEGSLLTK